MTKEERRCAGSSHSLLGLMSQECRQTSPPLGLEVTAPGLPIHALYVYTGPFGGFKFGERVCGGLQRLLSPIMDVQHRQR